MLGVLLEGWREPAMHVLQAYSPAPKPYYILILTNTNILCAVGRCSPAKQRKEIKECETLQEHLAKQEITCFRKRLLPQ